jgi:hypothetical protein
MQSQIGKREGEKRRGGLSGLERSFHCLCELDPQQLLVACCLAVVLKVVLWRFAPQKPPYLMEI